MLKIDLIRFQAQDVITTSLPVPPAAEAPVVPDNQDPPQEVFNCTCTTEAGIPQWALDIHGNGNGHGSCQYTGNQTHLCGKN